MNGYTSITATMTENGIKTSRWLNPANAVILDIDLLRTAPLQMTQAGLGDLAAREICNADWKLSEQIRGTSFCPLPFMMMAENQQALLNNSQGILSANTNAYLLLAEATLMSGLSMTIIGGETSPSSGAEHILSHFWDFQTHNLGAIKNLHGTQVGVATNIILTLYEYMRSLDPGGFDPISIARRRPSVEDMERENAQIYGAKASAFNEVMLKKRVPDGAFVDYLKNIQKNWGNLWQQLDAYIAPVTKVRQSLLDAGAPIKLSSIHRSKEQGIQVLMHGNRYRPRYSILDLSTELGIFPDACEEILGAAEAL